MGMAEGLEAPPVLSTPDSHILEYAQIPASVYPADKKLSDEELRFTYDIDRTLREIRRGRWKRIALQFPDEMLPDAPRVFQLLSRGLAIEDQVSRDKDAGDATVNKIDKPLTNGPENNIETDLTGSFGKNLSIHDSLPRLYILGDTSYGTCCVDEVAAEHVNADVVVHYGRACLSPTARLPVIYVFTHRDLDIDSVISAFKETHQNKEEKVVLAADTPFADFVPVIASKLEKMEGYKNIFPTEIVHNPSSPIPNRTVPQSVDSCSDSLREWQLFHISEPPAALLLTLSSRVSSIHIYPTDQGSNGAARAKGVLASTTAALRRRYATLTSLSTVPIFGILINTLSVNNYLHIVDHVKSQIAAAGKKSYMFVVGKLNAAKVANFSEIGGWVVIGCWESSLIDSKDFWKPIITPYELELALKGDAERVWTGEWRSDYQTILDSAKNPKGDKNNGVGPVEYEDSGISNDVENDEDAMSEPESAPPDFDLRTGRYVSTHNTRPMNITSPAPSSNNHPSKSRHPASQAITKRANGDVATIGGVVSPGAEFLRSQRTWKGLGSDFEVQYEEDGVQGTTVVEGRSGIARGYTVGGVSERH